VRLVRTVWSVYPDDHVEMDQSPGLKLGHLSVGQAGLAARPVFGHADVPGELADDRGGGAVPQNPGQGVPDNCPGIVVRVGVDSLAQTWIVASVAFIAASARMTTLDAPMFVKRRRGRLVAVIGAGPQRPPGRCSACGSG
jgi:hypothetical protein